MAKVLVIDDEQGVRSLLDTLLSRKGYDIVLTNRSRKGPKLFRRERPDVIVLDLNMPELDGIAVLQQLRDLNPDRPVIMLTGAGTPGKEHRVHALSVSGLSKEFSLHRLADALKVPHPAT